MNFESFNQEVIVEYVSLYGLRVLAAIAIFAVGRWAAKIAIGIVRGLMEKAKVDAMLISFLGNILYGLALTFVVIAALSQLGIETTSLAAIIAAAGLAIGLSLQSSLSNLASGVMIIMFRPFKIGDFIEAAGVSGSVEEISIFTTNIKTGDNKKVIVPNGKVTSGTITNYSANKTRRIDLVVGVSYDDDLKKVKAVLSKILAKEKRILDKPEPAIAVLDLADNAVNLYVRPWVKTSEYGSVRGDLLEIIKTTFDKEGISMPYPQRDVRVITGSGQAINAVKLPVKKKASVKKKAPVKKKTSPKKRVVKKAA